MDAFFVADGWTGTSNTGGWGDDDGYHWSTGTLVPYEGNVGMQLTGSVNPSYIIIDGQQEAVVDGPEQSLYPICETGNQIP